MSMYDENENETTFPTTTRRRYHPSDRLYHGEVENGGDAMETLIAACDVEIGEAETFRGRDTETDEGADAMSTDKLLYLLQEYKRAATYAYDIYRDVSARYPAAGEEHWCERTAAILARQVQKMNAREATAAAENQTSQMKQTVTTDFIASLQCIAGAFEAQDWQTLAI